MDGRTRRDNMRIIGLPELAGACSPTTIAKMLMEVITLDTMLLIDYVYREPCRGAQMDNKFTEFTEFTEAKRLLRGRQEVRCSLLFPAWLCITHGRVKKMFVDPIKVVEYIKENINPATSSKDQNKSK